MLYTNHIFQCIGDIVFVEFQKGTFEIPHKKNLTDTLKDVDFIHMWICKSY